MAGLPNAEVKRSRQTAPLLEEAVLSPAAEISLGALLRWCWLGIFPCYDVPDFKRQQQIRSELNFGQHSYPMVRRCCQSRRHRCCWLCCAAFGPMLAVIVTALYIFYTAYLPAVSRQHPALYDTNGSKIEAHGGQMIMHEGIAYWYGESRKSLSARGYPVGVNQGWTNEGVRLAGAAQIISCVHRPHPCSRACERTRPAGVQPSFAVPPPRLPSAQPSGAGRYSRTGELLRVARHAVLGERRHGLPQHFHCAARVAAGAIRDRAAKGGLLQPDPHLRHVAAHRLLLVQLYLRRRRHLRLATRPICVEACAPAKRIQVVRHTDLVSRASQITGSFGGHGSASRDVGRELRPRCSRRHNRPE